MSVAALYGKDAVTAPGPAARLEGDECTIILEQVGPGENVKLVANKILDAISPITKPGSRSVYITGLVAFGLQRDGTTNSVFGFDPDATPLTERSPVPVLSRLA